MRGLLACARLLVVSLVMLPSVVLADPEIWLVLGTIEPCDAPPSLTYGRDAFRPEAGAIALREGDVTVMPACDTAINLGFRSREGASPREKTVLRLQKKRVASGCVLEVSAIGTEGRRTAATDGSPPRTAGTSGPPPSLGRRPVDGRDLPCGTELIEVRQSGVVGSSLTVRGVGQGGDCHEDPDDMDSPLSIRWLDEHRGDAPPP